VKLLRPLSSSRSDVGRRGLGARAQKRCLGIWVKTAPVTLPPENSKLFLRVQVLVFCLSVTSVGCGLYGGVGRLGGRR